MRGDAEQDPGDDGAGRLEGGDAELPLGGVQVVGVEDDREVGHAVTDRRLRFQRYQVARGGSSRRPTWA